MSSTKETSARDAYTPRIGTYEEGMALLDAPSPINPAPLPVSEARIAQYCALVEDSNPSFWDKDLSTRIWGRPIAPPGSLQGWTMPYPWAPEGYPRIMESRLFDFPLPGDQIINVSTDIAYHRPIFEGDRLRYWDKVIAVSDEKTNRLGTGHFVTTEGHFETEDGEIVAIATNVMFRYRKDAA